LEEKYGAWQKDMEDKDIENTVARLDEQEKRVKERVASRLISKEEASKDIAVLIRRQRKRVAEALAEASRSPATAHDLLPLQVQSEKVERLLIRQAALSPKM
jgi:hypothetical protein